MIDNQAMLIGVPTISEEDSLEVIHDILNRIRSPEFKRDPLRYMASWAAERGPTNELRMPDDVSRLLIDTHLDKLTE